MWLVDTREHIKDRRVEKKRLRDDGSDLRRKDTNQESRRENESFWRGRGQEAGVQIERGCKRGGQREREAGRNGRVEEREGMRKSTIKKKEKQRIVFFKRKSRELLQ